MKVPLELIKDLRARSSASVTDCKKALQESDGNIQKALEYLRKKGLEFAAKKKDEKAHEGRIEAYVHLGNKLGVLVEVNCETDFVARNSDFCQFTKDIAMQIAASSPLYIKKEDVPADVLKEEKDTQAFCKEKCLLEQPFVKDPSMTVHDYLGSLVAKIGENIIIRRFIRYRLGD
ncbi:MAG: elongation factor Ts [Candidatus Omnitrophota bacterium]